MIAIDDLRVQKNGLVICGVPTLSIDAGELVAIQGGNGSGKTTLMRVLAGIERDYQGTCRIAVDPREVVFVHQSPYLFRGTVLANVTYGLRARGTARSALRRLGLEWLERCGAANLADKAAIHLSGGERKRVAVARALAVEAKLILLDEPLEEVDATGISTLCQLLNEVVSNATVLMTTPAKPPKLLAARLFEMTSSRRESCK